MITDEARAQTCRDNLWAEVRPLTERYGYLAHNPGDATREEIQMLATLVYGELALREWDGKSLEDTEDET